MKISQVVFGLEKRRNHLAKDVRRKEEGRIDKVRSFFQERKTYNKGSHIREKSVIYLTEKR